MRQRILLLLFFAIAVPAHSQESRLGAEFRKENERLRSSCSSFALKSLGSCALDLFTDHPLHIAAGSIAPQNGFGAGLALVDHWSHGENWRLSWNADAIGSTNTSWRAGIYLKVVHIPTKTIGVATGSATSAAKTSAPSFEYPVLRFYAQAISLNKLDYFGLGPSSTPAGRSFFGMRETIVGVSGVWPVLKRLKVSLMGELNGRFINLRGSLGQASPSIEALYTPVTAPGLGTNPGFVQSGEGVRIRPTLFSDFLRLDYFMYFQQYFAPGNSSFSFRRFTVDFSHQIPIYRKTTRTFRQANFNNPDECAEGTDNLKCPGVTRNLEGNFGIRLFISESIAPAGHVVPFYFDPTLGGSDINGNAALGSYQDYRFRAPNVLLLRGTFEHSIYGPLGFSFQVDVGKVALKRGDIDFSHLAHSYSAGFTLRAGGFPQVWLLYAWGGHEGTHVIGAMNTALLGGSARPSLF
jgi:hypothetical protein